MKPFYLFLGLMLALFACAAPDARSQNASHKKDTASKATNPDEEYVFKLIPFIDKSIMEPPYGLDRLKALIAKMESESTDKFIVATQLDAKVYDSLSFNEKFTYHMIHPESYSQNCSILPTRTDEANRIYGQLPHIFGEFSWSSRQYNFFKDNRDSVQQLIKSVIEKNRAVGENFKKAIVIMNSQELIPLLIGIYNKEKKDHYILTALMLLMKENNYPEFMKSAFYRTLYDLKTGRYSAHLTYNNTNEALIIQQATNFYNGLQAK
ncbi:hypothetical protein A3860_11235 [Niastella vici]|uniref:DUF4835 domain-containing protein n=1 Tax=Niastella vici TaxID=1703345 RepID=A0A1V9FFI6_9BACT|nr:hypothetical protein [Niastella vici]OQP57129.1 hypothetical protein A3860_11235 [Niastella vici]